MLQTTLLLICSNVFMTFAWYAHLKEMSCRSWFRIRSQICPARPRRTRTASNSSRGQRSTASSRPALISSGR
ncbi:MAG: hypothetical protein DWH83_03725 [Planctomycetota bacterium]|nr:MAG: hypothetical protein DWH83_03725 [Planctomycetota bacterium]